MNLNEFRGIFERLEACYGAASDGKSEVFFEKFKAWSKHKFSRVVELAIEECDRFPSIASLMKRGSDLADDPGERVKTSCGLCRSSGHVSASKDGYTSCFRCPKCENWQGVLSEDFPIFSEKAERAGYELTWHYAEAKYDSQSRSDMELLTWLGSNIPSLAKQIVSKNSDLQGRVPISSPDWSREAYRKRTLERDRMGDLE